MSRATDATSAHSTGTSRDALCRGLAPLKTFGVEESGGDSFRFGLFSVVDKTNNNLVKFGNKRKN